MRSMLKKLKKCQAGFSLAETLIAILILMMVSAIVAGVMPAASNVYTKTVDAANAQVLLSTSMNMLRGELGPAQEIEATPAGSTSIVYKYIYTTLVEDSMTHTVASYDNYGWRKIEFGNYVPKGETESVEGIWVFDGNWDTESAKPVFDEDSRRLLVSKEAITHNLSVKCGGISYNSKTGVVTFTNLQVLRDTSVLESRDSFEVMTLIKERE